jgi:hypothetical protein
MARACDEGTAIAAKLHAQGDSVVSWHVSGLPHDAARQFALKLLPHARHDGAMVNLDE